MTQAEMQSQMEKNLAKLRTLRDSIRMEIHLASMDAKKRWEELEPKFEDAEQFAKNVSELSRKSLAELVKTYESFRKSLKRHGSHPHPLV